jgi:hypothetical protein
VTAEKLGFCESSALKTELSLIGVAVIVVCDEVFVFVRVSGVTPAKRQIQQLFSETLCRLHSLNFIGNWLETSDDVLDSTDRARPQFKRSACETLSFAVWAIFVTL